MIYTQRTAAVASRYCCCCGPNPVRESFFTSRPSHIVQYMRLCLCDRLCWCAAKSSDNSPAFTIQHPWWCLPVCEPNNNGRRPTLFCCSFQVGSLDLNCQLLLATPMLLLYSLHVATRGPTFHSESSPSFITCFTAALTPFSLSYWKGLGADADAARHVVDWLTNAARVYNIMYAARISTLLRAIKLFPHCIIVCW